MVSNVLNTQINSSLASSAQQTSQHQRLVWIDLARTLAIILIVGFHVAYEFSLDPSLRPIGFVGVSLFFIISGFVLARQHPEAMFIDLSWIKTRYAKLASFYYPALIAIAFLFGEQVYQKGIPDLLLHFAFLNWITPETAYSIISPAWFIVPLAALYLFFPFVNMLVRKHSQLVLLLAFVITIGKRFLDNGDLTSFSPLFFVAEFCFGIAFAHSAWSSTEGQGGQDAQITGNSKSFALLMMPLLMVVVNEVMLVPFVLFLIFSRIQIPQASISGEHMAMINYLALPFTIIGAHTFEIFLFHESVMKAALGKWSVFGTTPAISVAVVLLAMVLCKLFASFATSRMLQKN